MQQQRRKVTKKRQLFEKAQQVFNYVSRKSSRFSITFLSSIWKFC